MSKQKKKTSPAQAPAAKSEPSKRGLGRHPALLFALVGIVFLIFFLGQWLVSLTDSYFAAFVTHDATAADAAANMGGLTLGPDEAQAQLALQREWDLFASSRLRDEVSVTARDGTILHGYFYNEGSSVTVVVLPRFHLDGTADFLPGPRLHALTGCNILLPDPRAHGESGGDYFGFGCLEQYDLAAWLDWAQNTLGEQTFLLWGEGTGANTILFAAANGLLPDSVACAVAESPYASLHQLAQTRMWEWYQLPSFPFLPSIEDKLASSGAGYTADDLELVPALADSDAALPVFFLQSAGDEYISPAWTTEVYDAYPGPKKIVNGGGSHGTVYAAFEDEIAQLVLDALAARS